MQQKCITGSKNQKKNDIKIVCKSEMFLKKFNILNLFSIPSIASILSDKYFLIVATKNN